MDSFYFQSFKEKWRSVFLLVALLTPLYLLAQEKRAGVTGTVQNERHQGVPGVSVVVKNETTGATASTQTNGSGTFRFTNLGVGGPYTVQFTSIGYEPALVGSLTLSEAQPQQINITLKESTSSLNQVVVVGYGVQRRKEITGAVASVRAADLKDQPVTSFEQAIAGKVPGVQVLQNTGAPGGSISVRIRGLNSISAGIDPLYVVDGIPLSNDLKNLQGSTDVVNI
ncbi:carboxypeptidase regulatory-like domain-containing protein, partial [Chitinophaga sp.]|uniref:carboxypeptidase regulatory-like domain-containing protein n=1 Tax=Chitinophaga sp. TaxID=1869181 RepID=UPI002F91D21B